MALPTMSLLTLPLLTLPLLTLILAGCAGTPRPTPQPPQASLRHGSVEESTIESTSAETYPLELGVTYESPVILGDYPLPDYPADQLALRLPPITVDVRVIVRSDGLVERVEPLAPPDEASRPFLDATNAALLRWEFSPLRRVENGFAMEVPFHQKYRFVFTQTDGKPGVGLQR